MRYLFFAFVYMLSGSCGALAQDAHTLEAMHLKDEVKSISQITFYPLRKGGHITKGDTASQKRIYFNPKGQLTKTILEDSPDRIFRDMYAYNARGQLKDHKTYESLIGLIMRDRFSYSDGRQLIKKTHYEGINGDLHKQEVELMDEKGFTKQVNNFNENDSTHPASQDFYTCKRDDQGRIRYMRIKSDDVVTYKIRNSYDEEGNLTEENEYQASAFTRNTSGLRQRITEYEYNQHGHITLQTMTDPEGRLQNTTRQEFIYDAHGNWVKKTTFYAQYRYDASGNYVEKTIIIKEKPKSITEREITYY